MKTSRRVAPPARRRTLLIVVCSLVLAVALAVMLYAKHAQLTPEKVSEDARRRLDEIVNLPEERILEKDNLLHALLDEDDEEARTIKRLAHAVYKAIMACHNDIHPRAELERQARHDVPPFQDRFLGLKERWNEATLTEVRRAVEEWTVLMANYTETNFKAYLTEIGAELTRKHDELNREDLAERIRELRQRMLDLVKEDKWSQAWAAIDDFEKRHIDRKSVTSSIADLRARAEKAIDEAVGRVIAQANKLIVEGNVEEARRQLEAAWQNARPYDRARLEEVLPGLMPH